VPASSWLATSWLRRAFSVHTDARTTRTAPRWPYRLRLVAERLHGDDRAEHLLSGYLVIVGDVDQDRWCDEESGPWQGGSAHHSADAGLLGAF
jgi:hypothetical protein